METSVLPPQPATTHGGWWVANIMIMVLGQVLLSVCLLLFTLSDGYLAVIDPRKPLSGPLLLNPIGLWYALHVGLIVIAMVACAGRLAPRGDERALAGGVSQAIGGLNAVGTTLIGQKLSSALYFVRPDDSCTYDSCWPLKQQAIALATPMVIAGVVMVVAALLVRSWSWWWRALLPPVLGLVLLLVQHQLWYSWLLPIFERPPS